MSEMFLTFSYLYSSVGSLQIITVGDTGTALYNCADLTFSTNATLLTAGEGECTNTTSISLERVTGQEGGPTTATTSQSTSLTSATSNTTSTSAASSSKGSTQGVALIAAAMVVLAMIATGII